MISLRGVVYKDDHDQSRWKWSGLWTFGTLPPHVGYDLESLTVKIPNVRPVHYVWENHIDASTVGVPSLAAQTQADDDNQINPESQKETEIQKKNNGNNHATDDAEKTVANEVNQKAVGDEDTTTKQQAITGTAPNTSTPVLIQAGKPSKNEDLVSTDGGSEPRQNAAGDQETAKLASQSGEESKRDDKTSEKGITFSTMRPDEPPYTEASTIFDCPPDGAWGGYFENIIRGRKADNRVTEDVSLFWNATPPNDAMSMFLDLDSTVGRLEEGRIHVRGMGTNQFGVFELLGSYDRETKVLEMQRMYVSTSEPPASKPSPSPKANSTRKSTASRAYSTRKRKLSWQKRSTLSDDEDEIVGMQRPVGSSKKKSRILPGAPAIADKAISSEPSSQMRPPGILTPPAGEREVKKPTSVTSSSSVHPGPKKRGGPQASCTVPHSSSVTSSPRDITLPSVGDSDEARWRAAHFLYYKKNDATRDENAPATSFVVYEGETLHGKSMRHGRGVCLYNNGTLYEGEWKRNREHGKGTLRNADRRRIIYEGEWERGRMHGQGIYYFRSGESSIYPIISNVTSNAVIPRYEGEFKENCRHGNGKYFLPDGSTYDGEWRENLMSGRGTFVWPDGSVYIGQWKDGKRHGQGLLRAADKFMYDGMWVTNSMEGRGTAEYPGGQKYEGLWSNGRRDGRGTIQFVNGAIYEGRFRDDRIEGQGTMKMTKAATAPVDENGDLNGSWMIPISFQSDMGRIHQKAGFSVGGE